MKPQAKKRLIFWLGLTAATVVIVKHNKYMKRHAPSCEDGQCARPEGYGLVINPFPDEILPQDAATNQPNRGIDHE